jgi:hypothetical protein
MMARIAPRMPAELAQLHADRWTEPFWVAAKQHRLVAPRCMRCNEFRMPPTPICWNCRDQAVDWVELSGLGSVYTFTTTRHPFASFMRDAVPYVIGVIALDDAPGCRLVCTVIDTIPEAMRIGLKVGVVWDDIDDDITIPRFAPIKAAPGSALSAGASAGQSELVDG